MFIICCSSHSSLIIRCSEGTVQLENISKPHSIQGSCCPCITDKQVKALISEEASPVSPRTGIWNVLETEVF